VYLWKVTAIIAVAVIGKFVGSAGSEICWTNWHDSSTIGADEYAWFNGVNRFKYWFRTKVLTPEVFTMMVMALATFMTGPALNLIGYILRIKNM
jgi:hypothetical protein